MKTNYDFSKASKNPYAKRLKKKVTRLIDRIESARKAIAAGKGASWRKIRKDV